MKFSNVIEIENRQTLMAFISDRIFKYYERSFCIYRFCNLEAIFVYSMYKKKYLKHVAFNSKDRQNTNYNLSRIKIQYIMYLDENSSFVKDTLGYFQKSRIRSIVQPSILKIGKIRI